MALRTCKQCRRKVDERSTLVEGHVLTCGFCGGRLGLALWERVVVWGGGGLLVLGLLGGMAGLGRERRLAPTVPGVRAVAAAADAPAKPHEPVALDQFAEVDEAMRFLRGVRDVYLQAQKVCDLAASCGTVAPRLTESGAVESVRAIPSCINERLPVCQQYVDHVAAQSAPASIAVMWQGVLDAHLRDPLERAQIVADMVAAGRRLKIDRKRESASVLDALDDNDPLNKRELAAMALFSAGLEQWEQLGVWLKQRGACTAAELSVACGLATVLGTDHRKVGARYADWYRPEQSPAEKHIRSYLAQRYKSQPDRLKEVDVHKWPDRTQASIYVKASDNLTVSMIRGGALLEARDIIRDLSEAAETRAVDLYDVSLSLNLQDVYQRDVETQVMRVKLSAADARQVNWRSVYAKEFERLLSAAGSLYVHPALGESD